MWTSAAQADFESINDITPTLDLVTFLEKSVGCNGICN